MKTKNFFTALFLFFNFLQNNYAQVVLSNLSYYYPNDTSCRDVIVSGTLAGPVCFTNCSTCGYGFPSSPVQITIQFNWGDGEQSTYTSQQFPFDNSGKCTLQPYNFTFLHSYQISQQNYQVTIQ